MSLFYTSNFELKITSNKTTDIRELDNSKTYKKRVEDSNKLNLKI